MGNIELDANHPNVLLVTGEDIVGSDPEFRDRLRDFLYSDSARMITHGFLIGRGSHDFWVTYRLPAMTNDNSNHSREDLGVTPRPLRGIIFMTPPADNSDGELAGQVGTLLQEVGHHWLVPADLQFHGPNGNIAMLGARDLLARINDDAGWNQPGIIGRSAIHWSTYFEGDGSPMDGIQWVDRGIDQRVNRWDQQDFPTLATPMDTRPDLLDFDAPPWAGPARTVPLGADYCDLDRVIMGAMQPEDAYPSFGNAVRWLAPFLTSNIPYHAGITVALSRFDQIYFGFFGDHRQLAVQRTGGPLSPIADLGDGHDMWSPTALRVVRRGIQMLFQAAAPGIDLIDGAGDETPLSGGATDLSDSQFKTIAVLDVPEPPVAVGALVKTWSPLLIEADYSELTLRDSLGQRSFPVDRDPPEFDREAAYNTPSLFSPNELRRFDVPGLFTLDRASTVRTRDGMLELATRFAVNPLVGDPVALDNADHWLSTDRAPKALVQVQPGDFIFGVRMRVRRSVFSPVTGGAARGCSMWGFSDSLLARNAIIPDRIRPKWDGDPNLHFAFIIVAPQRSDIPEDLIANVDLVRRLWDTAFARSTQTRWMSESRFFRPAIARPT